MALLLGTVFTLGILHKNNELSAIKAAGISIKRISAPLIIFGILTYLDTGSIIIAPSTGKKINSDNIDFSIISYSYIWLITTIITTSTTSTPNK